MPRDDRSVTAKAIRRWRITIYNETNIKFRMMLAKMQKQHLSIVSAHIIAVGHKPECPALEQPQDWKCRKNEKRLEKRTDLL